MNTDRVDVLDEADSDNVVLGVAYDLELELFPAGDALLNEYLAYEAGLETTLADDLQFVHIINKAAAGTAHRIGRSENDRIFQFFSDLDRFVYRVSNSGSRHLDAQAGHGVLELDSVLTTLDRVNLYADDLNAVFLEDACLGKLGTEVQSGLSAEVRKESIRALFLDDLCQSCHVQRLDICDIRYIRVCHDRSRVAVNQNDLVTELLQCFASLSTGVVKLTCLADDDRTGADDQDLVNVVFLGHGLFLALIN